MMRHCMQVFVHSDSCEEFIIPKMGSTSDFVVEIAATATMVPTPLNSVRRISLYSLNVRSLLL